MTDNEIVIRVQNITKEYSVSNPHNGKPDSFTALKNVSFDVRRGDVISIIGNNGSGKTTLLKILSNVTKPSKGEVLLYGTSTSILDIGNNFHPDLSGRENVHLQLSLNRKSKTELEAALREILEFSEIGDFFDQPVKHYSSGMFLRLAFSLAFHVASDILILDEVLSVGDEGFRLKCQDLLKKFTERGKTIVFVSHSRLEILELSTHCIWLEKGEVKKIGSPALLLGEYFAKHKDNFDGKKEVIDLDENQALSAKSEGTIKYVWTKESAPQNEFVSIMEFSIASAKKAEKIYCDEDTTISFLLDKKITGTKIGVSFFVQDVFYQSVMVGHLLNNLEKRDISKDVKNYIGLIRISCKVPADFLIPGKYYLHLRFGMEENEWNMNSKELLRFSERLSFVIYPSQAYNDIVGDISKGSIRPRLKWTIEEQTT